MFRVLKHARIPLFSNRKSNHIFTIWQHIVLVAIRQYEGKSYRMFVDWLFEAYYLRSFLRLSVFHILQLCKSLTNIISNSLLEKIISSFIVISGTRHIFAGIDSTGFKNNSCFAVLYRTNRI